MLGKRIVLAAALAAGTFATVAVPPSSASVFSPEQPFRVEGTVSALLDGGRVLVLSPVTGGTELALRRAQESGGEFRINVESAIAQPYPEHRSRDYYCGLEQSDYAYKDVCEVGTAVEIIGTFDKNGPLKNTWTADIARPVSGYGNSEFHDHTVLFHDGVGTILEGPLEGYKVELGIDCNAFGFDGRMRVYRGENSVLFSVNNTEGWELLTFDNNGPQVVGQWGKIHSSTGKFAGSRAAVYLGDPCMLPAAESRQPTLTFETEFAEPSPL